MVNRNPNLQCPYCSHEPFSRRNHLAAHIDSAHLNIKRYMCTDCYALYTRQNDLKDHKRVKHKRIVYPCRIELPVGLEIGCDEIFTRKTSRNRHLQSSRGSQCRSFHAVQPAQNVGIASSQGAIYASTASCPGGSTSVPDEAVQMKDPPYWLTSQITANPARSNPVSRAYMLGCDQNLISSSTFDVCTVAERTIGVAYWPLFFGSHHIIQNNGTRIRLFHDIHAHLLQLGILLMNKHISASRQQPRASREEFICTFGCVGLLALYSSWIGRENETSTHLSILGRAPFVEDLDKYAFKNNGYKNAVLSRNAINARGSQQLRLPDIWEHYTSEAARDLVAPHCVSVGVRNPSSLASMLSSRYSRDSGWLAVTLEVESCIDILSTRISEYLQSEAGPQNSNGLDSVPNWQVLPTPTLWIQHSEGRPKGLEPLEWDRASTTMSDRIVFQSELRYPREPQQKTRRLDTSVMKARIRRIWARATSIFAR